MITAIFVVLAVAGSGFTYRIARGPSLADRVLGLDGLLTAGVAAITTDAVRTGRGAFLPVAVVVALTGFVSTAVVARYIERRGA